MKGLRIDTSAVGPVAVAALHGEIDLLNADETEQELLRLAMASAGGLVVNLDGVLYADSTAVRMFFTLVQDLRQARVGLTAAIADASPLRRLLKVTNFDEVVPTLPTVDDAVAALRDA
ncbi:MAG: STAS domain-containing protein [Actinobacteria bacterium]|nr:STAS domain-containing protein [Actinomycetota bacterium]